jgi:hypothetical protein
MIVVVLLFAAGLLQFATLRRHHAPAEKRVNNGSSPTFFAFHINPSFNFSEDFHLYYVRAKRIAQRGWTDSLFYSRPDARPNYVAPVQVLISRIAILTDGSPRRYALFMFGVIGLAWSVLAIAARYWLPRDFSSVSIVLAVMVTVLFEATHLFFGQPDFPTSGIWPAFRGLRMTTMAWTNPVLLASIIGLTSLALNPRRRWGTLSAIALMLVMLLGADNWAFAMSWMATILTTAWIAGVLTLARFRTGGWQRETLQTLIPMGLVVAATFILHTALSTGIHGDALIRGGFGPVWQDAAERVGRVATIGAWLSGPVLLPFAALILLLGIVKLVPERAKDTWSLKLVVRPSTKIWHGYLWLLLLPVATVLALNTTLSFKGMETFLRHQMYWRADYCALFVIILAICELLRARLAPLSLPRLPAWSIVGGMLLISLLVYHNHRIHWFVKHVARNEFFLTADAEKTIDWLKYFEKQHGQFELGTASLELNYLAAFYTNADLLLPSGFPYHNGASNQEVYDRALSVLRLYGATQQNWLAFTDKLPSRFQEYWAISRVRAAGRAYPYHLFHRWTYFQRPGERANINLIRSQVGEDLERSTDSAELPQPDVLLVDDISRSLGNPDLHNYRRVFASGSVEAWLRNDIALPQQSIPASTTASRN